MGQVCSDRLETGRSQGSGLFEVGCVRDVDMSPVQTVVVLGAPTLAVGCVFEWEKRAWVVVKTLFFQGVELTGREVSPSFHHP